MSALELTYVFSNDGFTLVLPIFNGTITSINWGDGNIYVTDEKYRLPICLDEKASVYEKEGTYTVYHIALENENYTWNYGFFANGLLVESCSKRYLKERSGMTIIE